jgi:hypothetical protein
MSVLLDIPELAPGEAVLLDWTADRYHADRDTVSRSELEVLRESPQRYHALYIARILAPDTSTAAMERGTHVHLCVLEPEVWKARLYSPAPVRPENAKGNAKKDTPEKLAYVGWKSELDGWEAGKPEGAICLSAGEIARIEAIARAIRTHPFARVLFEHEGRNEQTAVVRDAETGVLIRVRFDRIVRIPGIGVVVFDLKTTNAPQPRDFGMSCARYGYHRQAAIYVDVAKALYPGEDVHYVLAPVCSDAPHEDACYELSDDAIGLGRAQYRTTLLDLVDRRESGDWRAAWQRGCPTLNLPSWAYQET